MKIPTKKKQKKSSLSKYVNEIPYCTSKLLYLQKISTTFLEMVYDKGQNGSLSDVMKTMIM